MALRSILLASASHLCSMASTPPEGEAAGGGGGARHEPLNDAPTPSTPTGSNEVVGEELPEGFTSWEDYRQKGGVLEGDPPKKEGEEDSSSEDPAKDDKAKDPEGETPEAKAARVEETIRYSTEGMAPEMAEKVTPFVKSFAENGTLTEPEIKAAAEATGMSEEMVKQYMDGATYRQQKGASEVAAAQEAMNKQFFEAVGGEAQYKALQEWGAKPGGLSVDEQKAFNQALDHAPDAAILMAKQFKARMDASGKGADPVDITDGVTADSGAGDKGGYASAAEQEAAQNDPRYREDAAYRNSVIAKIARSNF